MFLSVLPKISCIDYSIHLDVDVCDVGYNTCNLQATLSASLLEHWLFLEQFAFH